MIKTIADTGISTLFIVNSLIFYLMIRYLRTYPSRPPIKILTGIVVFFVFLFYLSKEFGNYNPMSLIVNLINKSFKTGDIMKYAIPISVAIVLIIGAATLIGSKLHCCECNGCDESCPKYSKNNVHNH